MLICPKCKTECQDGFPVCSNCGTQLIEYAIEDNKTNNDRENKYLTWLKEFGNITAQKAITILFYLGMAPLLISSFLLGKNVYLTTTYFKDISYIRDGMTWYTQAEVNNLPLGIFLGGIYLIIGILAWKIICELLIIIFRCFEVYVQKNR